MMLEITQLKDGIQGIEGNLVVPEIRVWSHPHNIGEPGEDYFEVFASFEAAHEFIATHPEAESVPLIAFQGQEINIYPETEIPQKG